MMELRCLRTILQPGVMLVMLAFIITAGCSDDASRRGTELRNDCSTDSGGAKSNADVTFYQDILPILSANTAGHSYKCTTCHAHYAQPDGLNNVPEVERIVDSLRSGRMPRSRDRVPDRYIEKFRAWQLQGFPAGDPDAAPTRGLPGSDAKRADGCAATGKK